LIKEIGFSLLIAAASSAAGATPTPADTARTTTVSGGLNAPALMSVDTIKRVFPVYFCGEAVPVGEPGVWRRWLQTVRTYGAQKECIYDLRKRSVAFFSIIDPILFKYRIPRDFRYLPLTESELVNDCVSPRGAVGYWQLMPETARELGLIVNGEIDERKDLRKATVAVCHYLHQLYGELRSWSLVAAAYNGGIGHVQTRMQQQGSSEYFKLRFHQETNRYLFRVLAYKELLSNPEQYRLLLPPGVMAVLTKPLPREVFLIKQARITAAANANLPDADSVSPTWGPRINRSLLETPSELDRLIASATGSNTDDFANQEHGTPVQKLLALMVLRFKRPRLLQHKKGQGLRPGHRWEWV
jgi:membrane-bound lytic murein transglycosylase D